MLIEPPASPVAAGLEWVMVAVAAGAVARLLTAVVRPWVDGDARRPANDRAIELGFVAAALLLWWWEAWAAGQLPAAAAVSPPVARSLIAARFLAHLVLGGLLAAAAWVDLRHRVIPDAITVPGVLLGLLWTGADSGILLPVPHEVARAFAAPLVGIDGLGALGGVRTAAPPAWLAGAPAVGGLALALGVFVAWWWWCSSPDEEPHEGAADGVGASPRRSGLDVRSAVLALGAAAIAVAWWRGGTPWAGQLASVVGLAVAAGLVWLTRVGASWALDQEALGFGDVTLMAMAGAWLGWQACVLACFGAVFIGLAHGLVQLATKRGNELPFGPSLCLALAVVVVAWRPSWAAAGPLFERPAEIAAVGGAVILLTAGTLAVWRRVRGGGDEGP
jgi:leader peptidase (prepilin peptidase)/N-methyltransferase